VARKLIRDLGIQVGSHVLRIGDVAVPADVHADRVNELLSSGAEALNDAADRSDVRMLDAAASEACVEHIKDVKRDGDSLGGIYEVIVTGVPVGLGSYVQWDRRLDGMLARAVMSVQAQKAVEIGEGIGAAAARGSDVHDEIVTEGASLGRSSNRAGGIEGGVSNGMPIVVRGYMKPIPTLIKPLQTVDISSGEATATRYERSDVTSVPAASTVAEAVVALEIANAVVQKFGGDRFEELRDRFDAWMRD
jgi:chorismate synthase